MKQFRLVTIASLIMLISFATQASININVKIGQLVGNQVVEVNRTISSEYNKEIVISPDGLKNKIVLNLKKFSNVVVNGSKINPVQIDMKLINEMKKIIGRPQTVTSFYNRTAQFAVRSSGIATDDADLNVSLNFEEIN